MDFNKLKEECLKAGILDVEVYQVTSNESSVSTFNGNVDDNLVCSKNEIYVRGVYNNHIATIYTEFDDDSESSNIINRIKSQTSVIESNEPYFIYEGSKEYPELVDTKHDYDDYSQADKIKLCQDLEKYFKDNCEYVDTTSVALEVTEKVVSIKNTKGLNVSRKSKTALVYADAVVKKDNDVKNNSYYTFLDNLSDLNKEEYFNFAVKRTVDSINAKSIKSNTYPVVFENKQFSSLVSCFLSMFSADAVNKKLSLLDGKLGQKVFNENITITDEPLCEKSHRKVTFDDEGVAASDTKLVVNGVLNSYLHNLKTAEIFNTTTTGNGFMNSSGEIDVAPTNLCFKASNNTFDEMIKDIKEGVFITDLMGTHAGVNPVSGAFNLQSSGFMIENGKITKPITLIIVSGNIIDVLNNVKCISNDFEVNGRVGTGSCYIGSMQVSGNE